MKCAYGLMDHQTPAHEPSAGGWTTAVTGPPQFMSVALITIGSMDRRPTWRDTEFVKQPELCAAETPSVTGLVDVEAMKVTVSPYAEVDWPPYWLTKYPFEIVH